MQQDSNESNPQKSKSLLGWIAAGLAVGLVVLLAALFLTRERGSATQDAVRTAVTLPAAAAALPATATRAPDEAAVAVLQGTLTPTMTSTALPAPTGTAVRPDTTPVAVQPSEGWMFEGVRVQPAPELGGLLVYGEAINNSEVPQRILGLQSALYDAQGQALTPEEVSDYWPMETVPPGWRMPFELTVIGPPAIDHVELALVTEPGEDALNTDFEISELSGSEQAGEYCVKGNLRNLSRPLESYLMALAVLYSEGGQVINYGIGYQPLPEGLKGDEAMIISACVDYMGFPVTRYELLAWGE